MTEEAVKREANRVRKISRAKVAAVNALKNPPLKFKVINSDNEIFCLSASKAGILESKIRVVINEITKKDRDLIFSYPIPSNQTKEIWCRVEGTNKWKTEVYNYLNELIDSDFKIMSTM